MADPLFHLAEPDHWAAARATGRYERSTLGAGLDEVGFIHLSTATQWPGVRARFYGQYPGDLVLLTIDAAALGSPVVHEVGDPATGEEFPHLYGPLPLAAVTATRVLAPPHDGRHEGREGANARA